MRLVAQAETERADDAQLTRMRLEGGEVSRAVWFRYPGAACPRPGDVCLAVALPAAMRLDRSLHVRGAVSRRLLEAVSDIQAIYHCWVPSLSPIAVTADEVSDAPAASATGRRCASLFTGGVDSSYTVLKRHAEIRALVFVHGFDVALKDHALRERVAGPLRRAAERLGRPLLEIETDLRPALSDPFLDWHLAFGSAMAAAGILVSAGIGRLYIPAGQSYHTLLPDGAHPVLNPLFSTEHIVFETDGCERTRMEKVLAIAENEIVMDTLKVCWENRGGAYNCGVCEKCLRTMASLEIAGALQRCRTFDRRLDYARLARTTAGDEALGFFTRENIAAAQRLNADPRLIRALERSLRPHPWRKRLRGLSRSLRRLWRR